jgi:hypothetical protein
MAKVNKMILGRISGTLGDITFRQRNGSNYIASRPSKFSTPQDEDAIARRSRFSLSVKLASTINSISQLKEIWELQIPADTTVYNYLVKQNYKSLTGDSVSANTYLVPGLGFGITPTTITLDAANIGIVTEAIGTRAGIDMVTEKKVQLVSVLCLSNPPDTNLDKTFLILLVSDAQALSIDSSLTFNLPLSNQETQLFNKYSLKKALFTIITLDADGHSVNYSNTFYKE